MQVKGTREKRELGSQLFYFFSDHLLSTNFGKGTAPGSLPDGTLLNHHGKDLDALSSIFQMRKPRFSLHPSIFSGFLEEVFCLGACAVLFDVVAIVQVCIEF